MRGIVGCSIEREAIHMLYRGSCHCGVVAFEVEAPDEIVAQSCNCSICAISGFVHLIVPKSKFRLLSGSHSLAEYNFNTGVAKHLYCKVCGIKAYYVPRSNPDGIDVNVRCLAPQPQSLVIEQFDGQNWERHAGSLAHLSKED